ncbi:lasso RiPP family leader peptide-containing protein [Streptomyces iconiensis]|uniref:Lasso RiPP family leader peptide-containing protein n=1 Tax=Streptomyces iconiensis TaxID=1384038 RepID=A0ABT7A0L1_9ACTN|nr:lasso RiPP family leader peptide-containing protein [Streptomyces iconiensis]MDJ1134868.1 lasso RiPP family leader peptide-containing protein [Streptomyces iconiensis]
MREETRVAGFEYEMPELVAVGEFSEVTMGYPGFSYDYAWVHKGPPSGISA